MQTMGLAGKQEPCTLAFVSAGALAMQTMGLAGKQDKERETQCTYRQIENVGDDVQQGLAADLHGAEVVQLCLVERRAVEQLRGPDEPVQWCAVFARAA